MTAPWQIAATTKDFGVLDPPAQQLADLGRQRIVRERRHEQTVVGQHQQRGILIARFGIERQQVQRRIGGVALRIERHQHDMRTAVDVVHAGEQVQTFTPGFGQQPQRITGPAECDHQAPVGESGQRRKGGVKT